MAIDAEKLYPEMDFADTKIDHSLVEVFLGDRWQSFDTHLIPRVDFARLQQKRKNRKLPCFSGVCAASEAEWNGLDSAYTQWLPELRGAEYPLYRDFKEYQEFFPRGHHTSKTARLNWNRQADERSAAYLENAR